MVEKKKSKSEVLAGDLRCNILSSVIFRADLAGIINIVPYITNLSKTLTELDLILTEDILKDEDILLGMDYNVISADVNIMKNALGKETVYRFKSREEKVSISISRYFITIILDYSDQHVLQDYIDLLRNLIRQLMNTDKFARVERLSLRKINQVICRTMNNLLKCFDKSIWNDITLELGNEFGAGDLDLLYNQSKSNFSWEDLCFNICREVQKGYIEMGRKTRFSYNGLLDIDCYTYINPNTTTLDYGECLDEMNKKIFEIYKIHLTLSFLNDLINGASDKVLKGVNKNAKHSVDKTTV